MPLNVRRFRTSVFGFLILSGLSTFDLEAQVVPPPPPTTAATVTTPQMGPPSSGDIMRDRISKSKAFIAVRNYNAAIFELENIRKESSDAAVQGVVNVLLMNSYLEQGDFKRAQDLLNEFYAAQKRSMANAATTYAAVAGQVVKGARSRAERYNSLGLNVSDRTLPLEALNDLEKMRETLELVITQAKEIGLDRAKTADAMAMLEEASNSRGMIARDSYDARRWKDEVADTREKMARSQSVVTSSAADASVASVIATTNVVAEPVAQSVPPPPVQPTIIPAAVVPAPSPTREREVKVIGNKPLENTVAQADKPVYVPTEQTTAVPAPQKAEPVADEPRVEGPKQADKPETAKDDSPLAVGSLIGFATNQTRPVYPSAAKVARTTGVVTVEVTVDETGSVAEVQKLSGPMMLQGAAKDAIRKWKFRPFTRDGQPVKATGFVNFNFSL